MTTAAPQSRCNLEAAVPRALASLWHASMLYEPSHPALKASVEEFCRASREACGRVEVLVEPAGLLMAGRPLEPASHYDAFAQFLHRGGVACLELFGPMSSETAREIIDAMRRHRPGEQSGQTLADRLNNAGAHRLRAHQISANSVRLGALTVNGAAPTESVTFSVLAAASMHAAANGSAESRAEAAMNLSSAAAEDYRRALCAREGRDSGDTSSRELASLQRAFAALSPEQRAELINGLGVNPNITFEDATGILALLPVEQTARFIDVLTREDSHVSASSLRLLQRLANLALGSRTDLGRLASIAEQWTSAPAEEDGDDKLAEATAALLRGLTVTDKSSGEYSEMLRNLSQSEAPKPWSRALQAADEMGLVSARAAESICEVLAAGLGDPDERAGMLKQLAARGRELAASGSLDGVISIVEVASRLEQTPVVPDDRLGARQVLDIALREEWVERVTGTCSDGSTIIDTLKRLGLTGQPAANLLVRAVAHCDGVKRRQALTAEIDRLPAEQVRQALTEAIRQRASIGEALCDMVEQHCPGNFIELFKSGIMQDDVRERSAAYRALARLVPIWPSDLCVRAMLDAEPGVRATAINKMAEQRDGTARVLVDSLAGVLRRADVENHEAARIIHALAGDPRPWITRRLAWRLVGLALWPARVMRGDAVAAALRSRGWSVAKWSALIVWKLSLLRLLPGRADRRSA